MAAGGVAAAAAVGASISMIAAAARRAEKHATSTAQVAQLCVAVRTGKRATSVDARVCVCVCVRARVAWLFKIKGNFNLFKIEKELPHPQQK